MSGFSMTLVGADRFKQRLSSSRARLETALRAAIEEVLPLLEAKAKSILDAEVYNRPDSHDKTASDALYNQFRQLITEIAPSVIEGELANISDHAIFIEDGTERGVRGIHFMSRAFTESRADILQVFERHLKGVCG